MLNLSLQSRVEIFTVPSYLFPPNPTINNFLRALGLSEELHAGTLGGLGLVPMFQSGLVNSALIAITVTILTVVMSVPAGYIFARIDFPFKNAFFFAILFCRALPPVSIVIPYYTLYSTLGMLGTHIGLILVYLTITVPLTTWVLTGFFASLPLEIDKAARVDGCSRIQALLHVIIPMAMPGIAATAVLAFLTSWNEFLFALMLGSSAGLHMLPPAIAAPLFGTGSDVELMTAISTIAIIPPIIAAAVLGKYIVRLRIVDPVRVGAG